MSPGMLRLVALLLAFGSTSANVDTRRLTSRPNIRVAFLIDEESSIQNSNGYARMLEGPIQDFVNNQRPLPLGATQFGIEVYTFVVGEAMLSDATAKIAAGQDESGNGVGDYHVVTYCFKSAEIFETMRTEAWASPTLQLNCGTTRKTLWSSQSIPRNILALTLSNMEFLRPPIRNAQLNGLTTITFVTTFDNRDLYEMVAGGMIIALDGKQQPDFTFIGPSVDWCNSWSSFTGGICQNHPDATDPNVTRCFCRPLVGSPDAYLGFNLADRLTTAQILNSTQSSITQYEVYDLSEKYILNSTDTPNPQVLNPVVFDFALGILMDMSEQLGLRGLPNDATGHVFVNGAVRYAHFIYGMFYMEFAGVGWTPVNMSVGYFGNEPDGRILGAVWENGSSIIGDESWGRPSQDVMSAWQVAVGPWFHSLNFNDDLFGSTDGLKQILESDPDYSVLSSELACMSSVLSLLYLIGNREYVDPDFVNKTLEEQRQQITTGLFLSTNNEIMWGQVSFDLYQLPTEGRGAIAWQTQPPPIGEDGGVSGAGVIFPSTLQEVTWNRLPPTWDARFGCPLGEYVRQIEGDCAPCPIGRFGSVYAGFWSDNNTLDAVCELCPAGMQALVEGKTACDLCPRGWYREFGKEELDENGVLIDGICAQCELGKAQTLEGQSSCDTCSAGTFADMLGATQCSFCQPGSFQSSLASSKCEDCSAGTAARYEGMSLCTSCSLGRYQALQKATDCNECAHIMNDSTTEAYSSSSAFDCKCGPGFVDPRAYGLSTTEGCIRCPKGVKCSGFALYKCRTGSFEPTCQCVGSGEEVTCSNADGTRPCPSYLTCPFNSSSSTCPVFTDVTIEVSQILSDCTFSHQCMWELDQKYLSGTVFIGQSTETTGTSSTTPAVVVTKSTVTSVTSTSTGSTGINFTTATSSSTASTATTFSSTTSTSTSQAPTNSTMVSSSSSSSSTSVPTSTSTTTTAEVQRICDDPGSPIVSAREVLEEEYYTTHVPREVDGDLLIIDDRIDILDGVWECLSAEACIGQDFVTDPICGENRESLNCAKCVENYASSGGAECAKCNYWLLLLIPFGLVLFYTVVGTFHYLWNEREKLIEGIEPVLASVTIDIALNFIQSLGVLEKMSISWPKEFQAILAIAKVFLFDVEVLRPGCLYPITLSSAYLGRLSLPLVLCGCFLTWWPVSRIIHRLSGGKFPRFGIYAMMNTVGMIIQALYISLVTTAVSLVECYESPNGKKAIRSYSFAQCPDDFTLDFGDQAEFMAMVPFFVLAILLYVVGIFGLFVWLSIMAPKKLDDPEFRKATRFLVFQLQPAMWWYQVVLMARSALLALVPIFSPDNGYVQILMFATVLMLSLVSHMALWPFSERMANLLEVWDVTLLMGMLIIATWFVYNDIDTSPSQANRLSIMLIMLVVAVISVVFVCIFHGVWESFNMQKVNARHKQAVEARLNSLRAAVALLHIKGDDGLRDFLLGLSYVDVWHVERLAHLAMLELCGLMPVKLSERRLSRNSQSFQLASAENLRALEEKAQRTLVEKLSGQMSFDKPDSLLASDKQSSKTLGTLEWDQQGEAEVWV